jgi:signal transduction histidine kinase
MSTDIGADVAAVQAIAAVPRILEVVCRSTGMGFAAVARVTDEHWICCATRDEIAFGLVPGGGLELETTICHEIRQSHQPVVIDHVAQDAAYCGHHTPAKYGFQSYISMPIMLANGTMFGTLCAIDPRPARLNTPETVGMFRLFAELIATHLDAADRLAASEASLFSERETSELREQFIAVLGHDLRNPLAAIAAGTRLLAQGKQDPGKILGLMQQSVARMSALIANVLDFARGRLGGGITLNRMPQALDPVLGQVVAELRAIFPESRIEATFDLAQEVDCDGSRIAQLFSNLLANSINHGSAESPIRVHAATANGVFELSVANAGEPIPAAAREKLFQPFHRMSSSDDPQSGSQEGLGLGLYIVSEIARAHGGTIEVASSPEETRFTFRMPLQPAAVSHPQNQKSN